jgi:hypothetical protein
MVMEDEELDEQDEFHGGELDEAPTIHRLTVAAPCDNRNA